MTPRRIAAVALFVIATGLVWIALLTPIRSGEIAALDAEAQRLGEEWNEVTSSSGSGNLLSNDDRARELLEESNAAYAEARDLEPPLDPLEALGGALLATSAGIALWPNRSGATGEDGAPDQEEDAPTGA